MIKKIKRITKKIKPWGFQNLSIYDVAIFFWEGIHKGSISTRASSLAFNFFLAFFPAIIFLFTLIPYIPISGFQDTLINILGSILPPSTNEAAFNTIQDIINNPRGGLLSIGFLLALYFSTNGANALIEAFNSSFHIQESRSLFYQRYMSLIITLILSAMLILTIVILIIGKAYIDRLLHMDIISISYLPLFGILKIILLSTMLYLGITLIFHLAPSKKLNAKILSPGTIFSTIFIIFTSLIFSYYVNNFSQYNHVYGTIGTLMIILLWI